MSASPECGGKCRALRGDRGKSAYTGKNIKILQPLPGFFALSRTFFITILPTAFYDRSRMTGRQVTPFYIKLFPFLLTLAPFVNLSVDTFILYSFFYALIYQLLLFKNTNSFSSVVRCPHSNDLCFLFLP